MTTEGLFSGYNTSNIPYRPGTVVTDILIRGGGGTITFSDNVNVEFLFGFIPSTDVPGGGKFGVTLEGPRAKLVHTNILTQSLCDTIDWLLQCSDLNRRVSILELNAGIAKEILFAGSDWVGGRVGVPAVGPLVAGQVGPHELGVNRGYHVTVWKDDGSPIVVGIDIEISINVSSGLITLIKPKISPDFSGRIIIS